jgi:hypothetical protein
MLILNTAKVGAAGGVLNPASYAGARAELGITAYQLGSFLSSVLAPLTTKSGLGQFDCSGNPQNVSGETVGSLAPSIPRNGTN